ncbi:MAG: hypothetical protein LBL13_11200 [Bacteroidales bacterium]|jgi:hypothetical protein|nr:hypothetical protein [Bacteroidales bacterium]
MDQIKQRNKVILILLIIISVVTAFAVAGIESPKAAIQQKLDGHWYIEFENSFMDRDTIYKFADGAIFFENDNTIKLPGVYEASTDQRTEGTWKVIRTNPDSVLFDVPENTLHGKYAIRFFIDNDDIGWVDSPRSILKIELKNDSTLLTCYKTVVFL